MKKLFIILSFVISQLLFSQKEEKKTMRFYINPSLQLGYNLGNSIKDNQNRDSPYYQEFIRPNLANEFSYGVGANVGYQIFRFFGLGTGIKYIFITDSLHLLSWTIQSRFFIGNDNEWKGIIELEYGDQLNNAKVKDSEHYSIKFGYQDSFSKRLNQEFGVFLQSNNFKYSNATFVGFYISVSIFSNKNYTVYGKD